jgi:large subunit ribosomal protein L31
MKAVIHPKWFKDAKITCACGNSFTAGAVTESIYVEVCSKCHPFYTGQMKYLDAAGRVEAFKSKLSHVSVKNVSKADKRKLKREKKIEAELNRPESLAALRASK